MWWKQQWAAELNFWKANYVQTIGHKQCQTWTL